jgi:hypothetical protein
VPLCISYQYGISDTRERGQLIPLLVIVEDLKTSDKTEELHSNIMINQDIATTMITSLNYITPNFCPPKPVTWID